jgi:predicted transcriptional regulator
MVLWPALLKPPADPLALSYHLASLLEVPWTVACPASTIRCLHHHFELVLLDVELFPVLRDPSVLISMLVEVKWTV